MHFLPTVIHFEQMVVWESFLWSVLNKPLKYTVNVVSHRRDLPLCSLPVANQYHPLHVRFRYYLYQWFPVRPYLLHLIKLDRVDWVRCRRRTDGSSDKVQLSNISKCSRNLDCFWEHGELTCPDKLAQKYWFKVCSNLELDKYRETKAHAWPSALEFSVKALVEKSWIFMIC